MHPNNFTHLHLHTEHSLLDGINRIDKLPEYIKAQGMNAVSITDHGTLAGIYKFYKSCNKHDVKPIIGMEAYYTVNDRTAKGKDELNNAYYHLVLIAMNAIGLKNLIKLSSESYISGF
jgi:DNA polymerase-3 subunit alpha